MSSFPLTVIFFKMGTLHQFAPPTSHNHHRPQSWYKFRCTNAFLDISGSVRNCSNPELFAVDRTRFFGSPRTGQVFFFTQKFIWYTGYTIKIAASNCPFFSINEAGKTQKKRAAWPIKIFKVSRKTVTIRQVGDAVAEMLLGFFDFWAMGWAVFQRATIYEDPEEIPHTKCWEYVVGISWLIPSLVH